MSKSPISLEFAAWVFALDNTERVLVPAGPAQVKRNETFAEFFANRSSN